MTFDLEYHKTSTRFDQPFDAIFGTQNKTETHLMTVKSKDQYLPIINLQPLQL